MNKKLFNNKTGKGLVSLITIIILLSSILATTIVYQNNITANVIKETSIESKPAIPIKGVDSIRELSELNEGWYQIRNGYVYYLEHFDSYVPLYIKVNNLSQQNGLLVVESDGTISFDETFNSLPGEEIVSTKYEENKENQITGKVTGFESVSGFDILEDTRSQWTDNNGIVKTGVPGNVGLGNMYSEPTIYLKTGDKVYELELKDGKYYYKGTDKYAAVYGREQVFPSKPSNVNIESSGSSPPQRITTSAQTTLPQETTTASIIVHDNYKQAIGDENLGKGDLVQIGSTIFVLHQNSDEQWFLVYQNNPNAAVDETGSDYVRRNQYSDFIKKPDGLKINNDGKPGKVQISSDTYYFGKNGILLGTGSEAEAAYKISLQQEFKFAVYDSDGKLQAQVSISASNKQEAIKELQNVWPTNFYKIQEVSSASPAQNLVPGLKIQEVGVNNDKTLITYNGKYIGTYAAGSEDLNMIRAELEKFEKFKNNNKNSGFNDETLWQLYYNQITQSKELTQQILQHIGIQIVALLPSGKPEETLNVPQQLKDDQGIPIKAWKLPDGTLTTDENKVKKIIEQQFAAKALADLKLTSLNKADEQGRQLAKKGNDIYYFDTESKTFNKITSDTYKIKETIGSGENAVNILRTIEIRTGKQTEIKIIKGKNEISVDEQTVKNIEAAQKSGFSFDISSNAVEVKDKQGNIIQKTSFSDGWTLDSGTKTVEGFRIIYFNKNTGKKISQQEYDKLKPEDKQNFNSVSVHSSWQDEGKKDGKLDFITNYNIRFENGKEVYEGTSIDSQGHVTKFIYGEIDSNGRKRIVFDESGNIDTEQSDYQGDKSFEKRATTAKRQEASRRFFASVERVFTEYRGLGYYATLFFDDDFLLKWREKVDETFAKLYLGTEYWSSSVCSQYIDGEQRGIAFAETPQGLAQIGAHVEATRTQPITTTNATVYIYKITFNVRNGDFATDPRAPEEMNINIILKGDKTVNIFKQDQKIKRGATFGKSGKDAIVKDSPTLYKQICIKFDKIPLRWKLDNKELCNTIQESAGEPTKISIQTAAATPASQAESDINDF